VTHLTRDHWLHEAGDRRADATFTLETLDFENLALGFGVGMGRKILAHALAIQLTSDMKNDFPGGIRELRNDERSVCIHSRLATSTGKSVVAFFNPLLLRE
jgi:hypothetical protein